MSITGNGHLPAAASTGLPDHSSASASDSEPEGDADYLPISGAASDTDSDNDPDPDPDLASHHRLDAVDNGVSELDLASDDDEEEEESNEEEGTGATEAAASLDDERRRRAQLPAGAAARIVDAMRGVAFPGAPPPWAGAVPDEQWLERLRSLRGGRA